jgi:hypothetical protein
MMSSRMGELDPGRESDTAMLAPTASTAAVAAARIVEFRFGTGQLQR